MSFNIVTVNETLVVDSRLVAEGLGIEHANTFLRTIRKYQTEFEELGHLVFESQTVQNSVGAKNEQVFCYLNEDQATYAVTLSQNTDKVRECKRNLVKAFSGAKKQLNQRFYGDPLQAIAQQIQSLKEENQIDIAIAQIR